MLAELPKMSLQEVFDKVSAHLLKQNKKSIDRTGKMCQYRAGPLSCAIGCLIDDEEYTSLYEGKSVSKILENRPISGPMMKLLEGLQLVHDDEIVKNWPKRLEEMAKEFNLEFDE